MVLSNPAVSTVLMGARNVQEVEANVRAAEAGPLPPDVLARLDEIAAMVPFRPYEEPFGLPFGRPYRGPGIAR
jgi:aryl-alcohol dehydrogenase-like predicted oxidoreductase